MVAFVGIVVSNLAMPFPESLKRHGRGLRIGTIGFCIASVSIALRELVAAAETISIVALFIGFGLMIWGVVLLVSNQG